MDDDGFLSLPAPVDIDITQPESPGPDWIYQGQVEASDGSLGKLMFINRRDQRLLLVPLNGIDPPAEWGLLS